MSNERVKRFIDRYGVKGGVMHDGRMKRLADKFGWKTEEKWTGDLDTEGKKIMIPVEWDTAKIRDEQVELAFLLPQDDMHRLSNLLVETYKLGQTMGWRLGSKIGHYLIHDPPYEAEPEEVPPDHTPVKEDVVDKEVEVVDKEVEVVDEKVETLKKFIRRDKRRFIRDRR